MVGRPSLDMCVSVVMWLPSIDRAISVNIVVLENERLTLNMSSPVLLFPRL